MHIYLDSEGCRHLKTSSHEMCGHTKGTSFMSAPIVSTAAGAHLREHSGAWSSDQSALRQTHPPGDSPPCGTDPTANPVPESPPGQPQSGRVTLPAQRGTPIRQAQQKCLTFPTNLKEFIPSYPHLLSRITNMWLHPGIEHGQHNTCSVNHSARPLKAHQLGIRELVHSAGD